MKTGNKKSIIYGSGSITLLAAAFVFLISFASMPADNATAAGKSISVTDLGGRTVAVPADVNKVACLVGPSYEKVFLLGQQDKIKMRMGSSKAWATKTNPDIKNILLNPNPRDPNIEELVKNNIDVVFFWDYPEPIKKMTEAKIPVVSTVANSKEPETMEDFIAFKKKEINLYGKVLGTEAQKRAGKYIAYFDEKIKYVTARTSRIAADKKPKVYYILGPDAIDCFGKNSYPQRYIEMAGGVAVTKDTEPQGVAKVTMEQILLWNPDVIFMGRLETDEKVMKDPKWANVKAVINKKVFVNPDGVMLWDYGSEGILLMEFFAKKLHPDLFGDLDMIAEVKDFYLKFYNYKLTTDEANRILAHMPPAD